MYGIPYLGRISRAPGIYRWEAHCLGASVEDGGAVEVLVVFDGVAVLDDAFGAAECWRCARGNISPCIGLSRLGLHTRPM